MFNFKYYDYATSFIRKHPVIDFIYNLRNRKYINKYGYEATVTKRTNNLFERIENDRR